ncbi:MAG: hypothetical protein KME17_30285 [Cyanosarcina radialis HA8281-LM2]|nr:hypothetical protein [Cyanosarcina radialis HA8281-LM2]
MQPPRTNRQNLRSVRISYLHSLRAIAIRLAADVALGNFMAFRNIDDRHLPYKTRSGYIWAD